MMAIGSVMTWLMNIILINYTAGKETAATVFGAYFKLNSFVFMPVFGLNNGVIPILAYNYGAQKRSRMTKTIRVSLCYASAFMLLGTIVFLAVPQVLLGFFNASETMLAIGEPALRIISTTFVVAGVCIVLSSVFQALGYSIYSMLVSLARQLIVLVPVAWALAALGRSLGNDDLVWLSFPWRKSSRRRSRRSFSCGSTKTSSARSRIALEPLCSQARVPTGAWACFCPIGGGRRLQTRLVKNRDTELSEQIS